MQTRVDHRQLFAHPANFLSMGFGTGLARYAPGTVGTLVALPIFFVMPKANPLFYLGVLILLFCIGIWCCGCSAGLLGTHDHPAIVYDEVVGMLLVLFLLPPSLVWLVLAFLLFRFFDIVKPWPIGWVDRRVDGGMGIMLDDILAGIMAWLVLHATYRWLLPLLTTNL